MRALRIAAAALLAASVPCAIAQGRALSLEWQVLTGAVPLERELVVVLKDAKGEPVTGAIVDIAVDMPSMPMMHRVPVARAAPSGPPGRYSAKVVVEMPGEWAANITVAAPKRASWVRKFPVMP